MTTFELGQRLVPNLPGQSILDLSMTDTMEVLDAVNAGLAMFWSKLPSQFKKTSRGVTVNAPTTFDGSTSEYTAGSTDLLLAGITTAALEGCSCLVGGDSQTNRLKSVNEFLLPPLSGTTSSHATALAVVASPGTLTAGLTVAYSVLPYGSSSVAITGSGGNSGATRDNLVTNLRANATLASHYEILASGSYGIAFTRRALGPIVPNSASGILVSTSGNITITQDAEVAQGGYDGAISGSLTVYGDAIQLGSDINRLLEPPLIIKADGSRYFLSEFPPGFNSLFVPSQVADPGYYKVDPSDRSVVSQSHTNGVAAYSYNGLQSNATIPRSDANYYLRLWPFPQSACRLLYTAELKADHLVWSDFSVSRTLKMVNADIEGTLIAIVIGELAKKRVFTGDVVAALRDQNIALERVHVDNATTGGRPNIKIGTARRY